MLNEQMLIPPHLQEIVTWLVETVTPLTDENAWSVTLNGRPGAVETDVRIVERVETEYGETRTERRTMRRFKIKRG